MNNFFGVVARLKIPAAALYLLVMVSTGAKAQGPYRFTDTNLSDDDRITDLISRLTIQEKISMLSSSFDLPRLGVRSGRNVEGIHGVVLGGPAWGGESKEPPTLTTVFPQGYGLGETWDPALLKRVGEYISYEARYIYQNPRYGKGGLIIWSPNADLGRDIRWGRTEECYGEDAFLTSKMVASFVRGLQGDNPKYWRSASLMKHFLANSNEEGRTWSSSDFDERLWHEYYAYPFYKGVKEGGANALMTAYNSYNGIPCIINPMLRDVVMKRWGVNGVIITDGSAFTLLNTDHKAFKTYEEAAAACLKAGITRFLDKNYRDAVDGALAKGLISVKEIDEAIRGNIRIALKLGLLDRSADNPYANIGLTDIEEPWSKPETKQLVREVTAKSVVLLKNKNGLLPLSSRAIKKIAVIGPRANAVLFDWYSGTPHYAISALEGIRNAVGSGVEVTYVASNKMDSAVLAARNADVAIVCVGNHPWGDAGWAKAPVASDGKEAVDRAAITMEQEDLLKVVYKANKNTVAVLISSFPFAISWTEEHVPAIVHITQCSQELGNGLADVLFGKVNPAGRLTQTWVKSVDELPDMLDYNIRNGRTYMYYKGQPLYPFGYGLSYTTFKYGNISFTKPVLTSGGSVAVSADVTNTGKYDGDEVVQLYVSYKSSKVERPVKELKGFARVFIKAGETRKVTIPLNAEDLAYWNSAKGDFEVENGAVEVMVGGSSQNIRLKKILEVKN